MPPSAKRRKQITQAQPQAQGGRSKSRASGSMTRPRSMDRMSSGMDKRTASVGVDGINGDGILEGIPGIGGIGGMSGTPPPTEIRDYTMHGQMNIPFGFPVKPPVMLSPPTEIDALREQIGLAITLYRFDPKKFAKYCDCEEFVFLKWLQSGIPDSDADRVKATSSANKKNTNKSSMSPRISTRNTTKNRRERENGNGNDNSNKNNNNNNNNSNGNRSNRNVDAFGFVGNDKDMCRIQNQVFNDEWMPDLNKVLKEMRNDEFDGSNEAFSKREHFIGTSKRHLNVALCQRINKKMKIWFDNFLQNGLNDAENMKYLYDYNPPSPSPTIETLALDLHQLSKLKSSTNESVIKTKMHTNESEIQSMIKEEKEKEKEKEKELIKNEIRNEKEFGLVDDSSLYYNSNPKLNFAKTADVLSQSVAVTKDSSIEEQQAAMHAMSVAKSEALLADHGLGVTRLIPITISETLYVNDDINSELNNKNIVEINEEFLWDPSNDINILRAFIEDLSAEYGQCDNNKLKSKILRAIRNQIDFHLKTEREYFLQCCKLNDHLSINNINPSSFSQHIQNNMSNFGNKTTNFTKMIEKEIQNAKTQIAKQQQQQQQQQQNSRKSGKGSKGGKSGNTRAARLEKQREQEIQEREKRINKTILSSKLGSISSKDYEMSAISNLLKLRPHCHGHVLIELDITDNSYKTPLRYQDRFLWNMNDEFYYNIEANDPSKRKKMDILRLGTKIEDLKDLETNLGQMSRDSGFGSRIEDFAKRTVCEQGLPRQFAPKIAHSIRRQLLDYQAQTVEKVKLLDKMKKDKNEIGIRVSTGDSGDFQMLYAKDLAHQLDMHDPINYELIRPSNDKILKERLKQIRMRKQRMNENDTDYNKEKERINQEKEFIKDKLKANVWQPKLYTKG